MKKKNKISYISFLKDGIPLLTIDFYDKGIGHDPILLSAYISAVKKRSKEKKEDDIKFIKQKKLKFALEEGTLITTIFIAPNIDAILRKTIKKLTIDFEYCYFETLKDDCPLNLNIFKDFKTVIIKAISN
ncbi:MAG: hypothetical protein KGD63_07370 [Candidatus Lokiarchaeota archaeon]|nr:hypothetical protein [Candidatus Lokiarchaeota archaeon]